MTPWDWVLIIVFAGTLQPIPGDKGFPLPSRQACIRAEYQVQERSPNVNALCMRKSTEQLFDFLPYRG